MYNASLAICSETPSTSNKILPGFTLQAKNSGFPFPFPILTSIEVRMGKGKGNPEFFACRVKPGRILFEVDGVSEQIAKEALYKASAKLPIKTKTIKRFA